MKPVTAYFSLLAALDDAGLEIDVAFFDYVRAIIELKSYEKFAPGLGDLSPTVRFANIIEARAEAMKATLSLTPIEKALIWMRR